MMSLRIFNFLLVLISFYITVSTYECAKEKKDHFEGTCNQTLWKRPSASLLYDNLQDFNEKLDPYKPGDKDKVKAERNHVIPYNTVRDFYNKLVERIGTKQSDAKKLQPFFDAIYQSSKDFYMNYCQQWKTRPQKEKIAATEILQKFIKGLKDDKLLNDEKISGRSGGYADFTTYFTWLPGNLFIGPDHLKRSDDPGDSFEINATKIIPQTEFTFLKNANELMLKYIKNPADKSINFSLLSTSLRSILSRTEVYPFKKKDWDIDPKNKEKKPFSIKLK